MATETIEVPRLATVHPEEVPGNHVSEANAGHDWLHDIPGEEDVGSVLGKRELKQNGRCEEHGTPSGLHVTLFAGFFNLGLKGLQCLVN